VPPQDAAADSAELIAFDRASLVTRLWRTAERQLRDIEDRLARDRQQPPDERERDARTLAVLVKALRDLSMLDGSTRESTDAYDGRPRDIVAFRRELARKMDAFIERKLGRGVSGDAESG
jgi:hypothetical protein